MCRTSFVVRCFVIPLMIAAGGLSTVIGEVRIAQTGQAAPGTGGVFSGFGHVSINDREEVVFNASVEGGDADGGIFLYRRGELVPVVLTGSRLVEADESTLEGISTPVVNNRGQRRGNRLDGAGFWRLCRQPQPGKPH